MANTDEIVGSFLLSLATSAAQDRPSLPASIDRLDRLCNSERTLVLLPPDSHGFHLLVPSAADAGQLSLWKTLFTLGGGAAGRSPLGSRGLSTAASGSTSGSSGGGGGASGPAPPLPFWFSSLLASLQIPQKAVLGALQSTSSRSAANALRRTPSAPPSLEPSSLPDAAAPPFYLSPTNLFTSPAPTSHQQLSGFTLEDWLSWNGSIDITDEDVSLDEIAVSLFGDDEEGALAFAAKMEEMLRILHAEQAELQLQNAEIYMQQFESDASQSSSLTATAVRRPSSVSLTSTSSSTQHPQSQSQPDDESSVSSLSSASASSLPLSSPPPPPPPPLSRGDPSRSATQEPTGPSLAFVSQLGAPVQASRANPVVSLADAGDLSEEESQQLSSKLLELQKVFQDEQKELQEQELELVVSQFEANREKQLQLINQAKGKRPRGLSVKGLLSGLSALSPSKSAL